MQKSQTAIIAGILQNQRPCATAVIKGSYEYPSINGRVAFYSLRDHTLLTVSLNGLPASAEHRIFGMHIHEGGACTGNDDDPFADAGAHYDPQNTLHPMHAGDLPPIFANGSTAWSALLTDRFTCREILGKTVILHAMPDDLMTQPSGNSGNKIACGVIRRTSLRFF